MNRRTLTAMGVVGAVTLGIVGCGASTQEPTDDSVTLTLWQPDTREAWLDSMQYVIDSFEEAHPNIKVDVVEVPWDANPKVISAAATGTLPDLLYGGDAQLQSWGTQGIVAPANEILASIGDDQLPAPVMAAYRQGDDYFGVPLFSVPQVLWYRSDWFAQEGLAAPSSWEELLATAESFTGDGSYGFSMYNKPPEADLVLSLMGSNDAWTFDVDGAVVIDSENAEEVVEMIRALGPKSPPGSENATEADARIAFQDGCCAMLTTSTSFADLVASDPELSAAMKATVIPSNRGDRAGVVTSLGLGVTASAEHPEEARMFIEHWMSPEVYVEFATRTVIGFLPVLNDVSGPESAYWSSERIAPVVDVMQAGVDAAKVAVPWGGSPVPNACSAAVLSNQVWENIAFRAVQTQDTPQAILADAKAAILDVC